MTYLGVDLAWNVKGRTGLAALDEHGALIASTALVSDTEIDAWIGDHAPHSVVAPIDAPLVVKNPSGQRLCETLIGRAFW